MILHNLLYIIKRVTYLIGVYNFLLCEFSKKQIFKAENVKEKLKMKFCNFSRANKYYNNSVFSVNKLHL